MKVVEGGEIIRVPEGWGIFCHECCELIEQGTECFKEDTEWKYIYHMWCRPESKKAQVASEEVPQRVPKRRMERVPA